MISDPTFFRGGIHSIHRDGSNYRDSSNHNGTCTRKLRDKVETKNIVLVPNTKDLIEEKRRQALARRAASQSQKQGVLKNK